MCNPISSSQQHFTNENKGVAHDPPPVSQRMNYVAETRLFTFPCNIMMLMTYLDKADSFQAATGNTWSICS